MNSRRRVNSTVKRRAARRRPKGSRRASSSIFEIELGCAPINDRELFPTRLRTGGAARRLTTRWSGHRSAAAPHSRAHKAKNRLCAPGARGCRSTHDRYPAIDRWRKIMDKRTCEKCGKIYILERFADHPCSPKRRKKRPKRLRVAKARKKRDGDESYIRPGLPSRKHRSVTRTREER